MISRLLGLYRQAFSGLSRGVWLLAGVTVAHRSGTMVLPFLSLYITRELGWPARHAGMVLAFYGVGAIAGAYVGGRLSDRYGSVKAQIASLIAAGAGFFALAAAREPWSLTLTVVLASTAVESFRPANAATVAELTSEEVRFRGFALRRLAINIGMTLGPAVGGFLATINYLWLFACNGSACWIAAGLLWALLRDHRSETAPETQNDKETGTSPWRDRPFLALLVLITVLWLVFFQLLTTYPLTLHDVFGLVEHQIGLLFAVNTLLIVLFEMVLVHSVDRFNPVRVAAVGAFLTCLGFGLLPLGSSLAFLACTIIIWTTGEMLSHPILEGMVANRAPTASLGAYLGLQNSTIAIGFVIAPVLGTWIYESYGYRALWFGCGAVGFVLLAGFWALSDAFAANRGGT